jgi:hypothetical protein
MNVVAFPGRPEGAPADWHARELQEVLRASASAISRGEASGWEVGHTEVGDPQFYLLGPAPDYECLLCISRLGRVYVLEDGQGRVLVEDDGLVAMAEQVRDALWRGKSAIVARIAVAWYLVRETIEERTDAIMAESHEMLAHFAPQLAALV